jgi:DNA-binding MarR family transcriptional regulator
MLASKQVSDRRPRSTTPTALDTNTATRLRVALARLNRRLGPTEAATTAGLTPTRISVLLHIARSGPIKLSQLAAEEGINPTMLSRIVGKLSDDGLLARSNDVGDRRAAWVELTPKGERLVQRMRRERTDALNLALDRLEPQDRHHLEQALEALERLAETLQERGR